MKYSKHFVQLNSQLDEKKSQHASCTNISSLRLYLDIQGLYIKVSSLSIGSSLCEAQKMFHNNELVALCVVVFAIARLVASDPRCSQFNRLDDTKLTNLTTSLANPTQPISEVFSSLWCANIPAGAVGGGSHVIVSLPREMVVYGVSTRGRCRGEDAYVNKFKVLYRKDNAIVKIPIVSKANKQINNNKYTKNKYK